MPRIARVVVQGIPHHVTQRGNYQQVVFLNDNDREQYLRGIHLMDSNSYGQNSEGSIFSKEEILSFRKKTYELNKNKDGDQAIFYLYKS